MRDYSPLDCRLRQYKGTVDDPAELVGRAEPEFLARQAREREAKIAAVRVEISRLESREREAIRLIWVEGKSYRQAAEILGFPTSTLYDTLGSAKRKLARGLDFFRPR